MDKYKAYLATAILTEDKLVTYRLLSRALKVNVNTAKEMLYEFHRQQNAKKPGIIHATYLLSGTKREEPDTPDVAEQKDGEDDYMQSSPFMSSSIPQPEEEIVTISTVTVSLVREENLAEIKSQYETINSIHVYSLGPYAIKDLQLLADTTREIRTLVAGEDPIENAQTYGTIANPQVRRRKHRRPPPVVVPQKAPPPAPKATATEPVKEVAKAIAKATTAGAKDSQSAAAKDFFGKGKSKEKVSSAVASGASSKESTPAPPAKLKKESSSLLKSFAKAKPKLVRENTDSAAEDVSIKNKSDDDDDDEESYDLPPSKKQKTKPNVVEEAKDDVKSQQVKQALADMMDISDEEEDVPTPEPAEEETILEKEKSVKETTPVVEVSNGRRRGKRRVTRKKTVKDEEGYLVTKEEIGWESFSEPEPAAPTNVTSGASKGKKAVGKAGKATQGSIMSFFGKK